MAVKSFIGLALEQKWGQLFHFRNVRVCVMHLFHVRKTAKLKVENSAKTTFRLSPILCHIAQGDKGKLSRYSRP
jgi:hypothetical protein